MVWEYIRKKEQTQRTSHVHRQNTHYSFFTIRCTPSSSAHASYKGYGCNNSKLLRPPHRNTISTLWYSGVVRFGQARERRHRLLGCIFSESAVGWNSGPVCGDGNWGEYSTLKGGGRHDQLVTGRSISMAPPARTP